MQARLAVLASGTGTILGAIIASGLDVAVVIVDRICPALDVAAAAGVDAEMVERESFSASFDRVGYSDRVVSVLRRRQVEVVAMAGFGTILAEPLLAAFPGRVLNTHPALLPAFKGWHAVKDCLAAGATTTGCTVHLASVEVDEGPILAQRAVPVLGGDTEATLHDRIKVAERELYPATICAFLRGLGRNEVGA